MTVTGVSTGLATCVSEHSDEEAVMARKSADRQSRKQGETGEPAELSESELREIGGGDGKNQCAYLAGSTNVFKFGGNG